MEDAKGSLAYLKQSLGYEVKDKITGDWFPVWYEIFMPSIGYRSALGSTQRLREPLDRE